MKADVFSWIVSAGVLLMLIFTIGSIPRDASGLGSGGESFNRTYSAAAATSAATSESTCTLEKEKQERLSCLILGSETGKPFILKKEIISSSECKYSCVLSCPVGQELVKFVDAAGAQAEKCATQDATNSDKEAPAAGKDTSADEKIEDLKNKITKGEAPTTVKPNPILGPDGVLYATRVDCVSAGACIEVASSNPINDGGAFSGGQSTGSVTSGGTAAGSSNIGSSVGSAGAVTVGNASVPTVGGASAPVSAGNAVSGARFSPSTPQAGSGFGSFTQGYTGPTGVSPYQSFQTPQSLAQPQSFIQRFVGGGEGLVSNLANFVTGGQAALRNTPQAQQRIAYDTPAPVAFRIPGQAPAQQQQQPQIVYVTPEFTTPASVNRQQRSVQAIASDIAAQTQSTNLARVDHFAQTLNAVGGPNAINTENKSFGRLQDLIVEDEAIRAIRLAEEEGRRAKNSVYCRTNEIAAECQVRREAKAQEVERKVFVEELEKRVLPDSAIQHFLAVYDGWVRPSPAPKTRATSTLGALYAQENNQLAPYEITTTGATFVSWIIENVADATAKAVRTLTNIFTGIAPQGSATSTTSVE